MLKQIKTLLLLLSLSLICFSAAAQNNLLSNKSIDHSPLDLKLTINKTDNDNYKLVAAIKLPEGSYIYSPTSNDEFYLPFSISYSENTFFTTEGNIDEDPKSIPEIDKYINAPVNFVRVNTSFTQELKITAKENFEVTGLVEFLQEPSCIPYDVVFVLSFLDGVVSVKQGEMVVSEEYKK